MKFSPNETQKMFEEFSNLNPTQKDVVVSRVFAAMELRSVLNVDPKTANVFFKSFKKECNNAKQVTKD